MFSQSSFQPLTDLPPQRPSINTTTQHQHSAQGDSIAHSSVPHTPDPGSLDTSPFHEGDEFDLDDPNFYSRSRTGSSRSVRSFKEKLESFKLSSTSSSSPSSSQGGKQGGSLPTLVKPEEIGGLLDSLSRSYREDTQALDENDPTVRSPAPRHHPTAKSSFNRPSPGHHRNASMDRPFSKSFQEDSPSSPESFGRRSMSKLSPSPSKSHHGHHLNALSPLQAFSPLAPAQPLKESTTNADASSVGKRSRSSSVTKSLSRRQSLIVDAEKWQRGEGDYFDSRGDAMNLFSRLTLVKAPVEGSTLKRAKSSSSIAPFSHTSKAVDIDAPATTARGPRRSFAAASFAGFSPLASTNSLKSLPEPFSTSEASSRITHLYDRGGQDTIHRKTLSPDEVFDLAQSLASPVAIPEGGFKGAELKRRKSAGAVSRRGTMDKDVTSPEKPPLALEPVEYVQLDEETLLPFVDRPVEVQELVGHASNASLFKLLNATFPKEPLRDHWQALSPDEWRWDELMRHLTKLSRIECPDYAWIFRARQAVRARSVALWEKLGTCLGCDGDLLNAGGEDGSPPSWGGLGLGEEGEYDPSLNHVYIEGLEAVDRDELARVERQFKESFGDIVEDEGEQASAGMTALLGTLGEEEEEEGLGLGLETREPQRKTTAQKSGMRQSNLVDPMNSPTFTTGALPSTSHPNHSPYTPKSPSKSPGRLPPDVAKPRSKSFVGLQILTSPTQHPRGFGNRSPSATTPMHNQSPLPIFDRGPGNPLFPSSFSSLSVEPNLGRSASVSVHGVGGNGVKPVAYAEGDLQRMKRWSGLGRKQSGAGLSESAITFASESDYSHSAPGDE